MRVGLSQGELSYDGHRIRVFDFLTRKSTKHTVQDDTPEKFGMGGHASADYNLISAFISAVAVSVGVSPLFHSPISLLKLLTRLSD